MSGPKYTIRIKDLFSLRKIHVILNYLLCSKYRIKHMVTLCKTTLFLGALSPFVKNSRIQRSKPQTFYVKVERKKTVTPFGVYMISTSKPLTHVTSPFFQTTEFVYRKTDLMSGQAVLKIPFSPIRTVHRCQYGFACPPFGSTGWVSLSLLRCSIYHSQRVLQ